MKRAIAAALAALTINAAPTYAADYYSVTLTRSAQDLYRVQNTRYYIQTRYCYEYAYSDSAVLIYDGPYSYGNKILFSSGATCEVKGFV